MAEIKPVGATGNDKYQTFTWANVTQADTFGAAQIGRLRNLTVQVTGTIGGATVTLQGSLDGVNFAALSDGTDPISITAAAISNVLERPRYIRPAHSEGTSESITVIVGGSVVY